MGPAQGEQALMHTDLKGQSVSGSMSIQSEVAIVRMLEKLPGGFLRLIFIAQLKTKDRN